MSYPSNFSSNGFVPGQSGYVVVAPQAIQSAIATHQYKSTPFNKATAPIDLVKQHTEIQEANAAYSSGKITEAEYDAMFARVMDAGRAYDKRIADFDTREEAGLANYSDWYKEFYGCTDEEAEERIRYDRVRGDTQRANEKRSRSRVLHQSKHGRGH